MSDLYLEELVKRRKTGTDQALRCQGSQRQRFDDNGSYSDQAGRTWTSQRFGG